MPSDRASTPVFSLLKVPIERLKDLIHARRAALWPSSLRPMQQLLASAVGSMSLACTWENSKWLCKVLKAGEVRHSQEGTRWVPG